MIERLSIKPARLKLARLLGILGIFTGRGNNFFGDNFFGDNFFGDNFFGDKFFGDQFPFLFFGVAMRCSSMRLGLTLSSHSVTCNVGLLVSSSSGSVA